MTKAEEKETTITLMFQSVPEEVRECVVEASIWARKTLTDLEGKGHIFSVVSDGQDGKVVCAFAKPEWAGDHCGDPMEDGAQAIVRAVCEYLWDQENA